MRRGKRQDAGGALEGEIAVNSFIKRIKKTSNINVEI